MLAPIYRVYERTIAGRIVDLPAHLIKPWLDFGERPNLKNKFAIPDVLLQAHSAPLGITFYTGQQFPPEYVGNIFAAQHGSWNRSKRTAYKVIRVIMKDSVPTGEYEDFATGFVVSDTTVWCVRSALPSRRVAPSWFPKTPTARSGASPAPRARRTSAPLRRRGGRPFLHHVGSMGREPAPQPVEAEEDHQGGARKVSIWLSVSHLTNTCLRSFDPTAEETLFIPRLKGG